MSIVNHLTNIFFQKIIHSLIILITICYGSISIAGEQISFSALSGDYWQIWTINVKTGELRQLTQSHKDKKEVTWFPDGKAFIFRTSNGRFYIHNLMTKVDTRILNTHGRIFDPHLSADGRHLLLTRFKSDANDNTDIWSYDLESETAVKLTNVQTMVYAPKRSPAKNEIVYVVSETSGHHIWLMNSDGTNSRKLTHKGSYNHSPDWSSDGKHIVYSSDRDGGDYEIWKMSVSDKIRVRLTHEKGLDTQPIWSSDGSKIYFVSNRRGHTRIWQMSQKGDHQNPLTQDEMVCSDPSLVPSG